MLCKREDFERLLEELSKRYRSRERETSIVSLVAADPDAMCAHLIFTELMTRYCIAFTTIIVDDHAELQRQFRLQQQQPVHWVLFNCGALVDLTEFMGSEHVIVVVDSARPIHLNNVASPNVKVCVDDDSARIVKSLIEGEEEEDRRSERRVRRRKRRNANGGFEYLDESEDEHDDDDESRSGESQATVSSNGRHQTTSTTISKEISDEYYAANYWGESASMILHAWANVCRWGTRDVLWSTIVGTTAHYAYDRCTYTQHAATVSELRKEVPSGQNKGPVSEEDKYERGRIQLEDTFDFALVRYWSFNDSMFHSRSVASQLNLYTSTEGRTRMGLLLAQSGLSTNMRGQSFSQIQPSAITKLKERLDEKGREFGLKRWRLRTFARLDGYDKKLLAVDLVQAIVALLAQPPKKDLIGVEDSWQPADVVMVRRYFWDAYKLLRATEADAIHAIELARGLVQTIVRNTVEEWDRKQQILSCKTFRYVILPETLAEDDLMTLAQAQVLRTFGHYIADAWRTSRRSSRRSKYDDKPFLIAAYHPRIKVSEDPTAPLGAWLVVGIGLVGSGGREKNRAPFGPYFREAAQASRTETDKKLFDPSSLWVKGRDGVKKFIEHLHMIMMNAND